MQPAPANTQLIVALGATQTLAWASSYYLPAMLAAPVSRALGIENAFFFAAFSGALIVAALIGPLVGRAVDRAGGRNMLCASNVVLAVGLSLLAIAQHVPMLIFAWVVLGIGMGMGLYDTAFATLTRIYGTAARGPITGITLIAGFASTIGWPITASIDAAFGWRSACITWAVIHLVVCLPINAWLLPRTKQLSSAATSSPSITAAHDTTTTALSSSIDTHSPRQPWPLMMLLAAIFAATWFVTGAMATHLPSLLLQAGASTAQAIAFAALVGPAQVAARIVEFTLLKHIHPVVSARIATALHPLGYAALCFLGPAGLAAFAVLHGAGNGLLTIAKGTLPLALLGPTDYGYRQGLIGLPARFTQALAPVLFGILVTRYGADALAISSALTLMAFITLWFVGRRAAV